MRVPHEHFEVLRPFALRIVEISIVLPRYIVFMIALTQRQAQLFATVSLIAGRLDLA